MKWKEIEKKTNKSCKHGQSANYASYAHFDLHWEKNTCHSPYPSQIVVGIHTNH
jgi:hypothetical protein